MKTTSLVSIVIPCYNSEKYIEKCVNSVINQTLKEIEIIIINDGSTDNTIDILINLEKTDSRITVFNRENYGVAESRNYGINKSKSKFLVFIDSDDFIDETMIEKLYKSIHENDVDLSFCGICDVFNEKEFKIEHINILIDKPLDLSCKKRFFYMINSGTTNKIFKRSIVEENNIEFLKNVNMGEDLYFLIMYLFHTRKIASIQEHLYYYRQVTSGSLSKLIKNYSDLEIVLKSLFEYAKSKKIYYLYSKELNLISRKVYNNSISNINSIKNYNELDYKGFLEKFSNFFVEYSIPEKEEKIFFIWGSYNLRAAIQTFKHDYNLKINQFMGSGVFSIMSKPIEGIETIENNLVLDNSFRKKHVLNDLRKALNFSIKESNSQFIVFDLLEEMYDIIQYKGSYITKSMYFDESNLNELLEVEVLDKNSKIFEDIWIRKCDEFIEIMKNNFKNKEIILVKNKLALFSKSKNKEISFENIENIELFNQKLLNMYNYIENKLGKINVIEVDESLIYSEYHHPFGSKPFHLSNISYLYIGEKILDIVENK